MKSGDTMEQRSRENERLLRDATDWLFADAAARTAQGSFGRQVLEVNWEGGRVRVVNIDQRHTLHADKPNSLPDVRAREVDGRPPQTGRPLDTCAPPVKVD